MEKTLVGRSTRERFMQIAKDEFAKFEREEAERRRKDRKDRARMLDLPISADEIN